MYGYKVGKWGVRYGEVTWVQYRDIVLLYLATFFLCAALIWPGHTDINTDNSQNERNNEPEVTVTVSPDYIAVSSPEFLDDSNIAKVINYSTVPVDAVIKAEDGRDLFLFSGVQVNAPFYFRATESCTITVSASEITSLTG